MCRHFPLLLFFFLVLFVLSSSIPTLQAGEPIKIGEINPLSGYLTMYLYPAGGLEATLIAIVITIFAGVGRTRGILLGGWLLGVAESLAAFVLGAGWRELVSAVLLISLLLIKPHGILIKGDA
jgi:branched-chain amino acid transport system permease protein